MTSKIKSPFYAFQGNLHLILFLSHYRKAIIVMPVWADGEDNARRLTDRGAAVRVHKGDDGDTLYEAIVEARYIFHQNKNGLLVGWSGPCLKPNVLTLRIRTSLLTSRDNPKYRKNVNHLADLYLASRHPPLDDAAWLMEFVATTRGAEHLKVASRHLSLIQLCNLDVLLLAIIVSILALKLAVKLAALCRLRLHQSREISEGKIMKKRQ